MRRFVSVLPISQFGRILSLLLFAFFLSIFFTHKHQGFFKGALKKLNPAHFSFPEGFSKTFTFEIPDLLLLFILGILFSKFRVQMRAFFWEGPSRYLTLFLGACALSIFSSKNQLHLFQYMWLLKFSLGILFFNALRVSFTPFSFYKLFRVFAAIICGIAICTSLLCIAQYFLQGPVGLKWLGEGWNPHAGFSNPSHQRWIFDAMSTLISPLLMRSSGLFYHPNACGGFLFFSLLLSFYFYLNKQKFYRNNPKNRDLTIALGQGGSENPNCEVYRNNLKNPNYEVKPTQSKTDSSGCFGMKPTQSKTDSSGYFGIFSFVIFLQVFALATTFSRSAFLALILSAALLFFCERKNKRTLSLLLVLGGSALTCLVVFYDQFFIRGGIVNYNGIVQGADAERVNYLKTAFAMFKDHWLLGVGFNNFQLYLKDYLPADQIGVMYFKVHNIYLLLLAETGICGFSCALLFFYAIVRKLILAPRTPENHVLMALILGCVLLGGCDMYLLDNPKLRLLFFSLFAVASVVSFELQTARRHFKLASK